MDVLKTGDRFTAKSKLGDEYEYEFVGIDLLDAGVGSGGTGCHHRPAEYHRRDNDLRGAGLVLRGADRKKDWEIGEVKMEREWKLGEDLYPEDNILDGITFDDLILAVHQFRVVNRATVHAELNQILSQKRQDMMFLLEKNMEVIIQKALEGRQQE